MLKGVNRQIVEINNPENEYFEKAILYVRAEKAFLPKKDLIGEADSYLSSLEKRNTDRKAAAMRILTVVFTAVALICAAALAIIAYV